MSLEVEPRSVVGAPVPLHLGWRSRRDTRVAIHFSISDSSQPTAFVVSLRLEGDCPRHSRRQSVVRDSPVRAQTSRHQRKRAGERPTCSGRSDASVPSLVSRALLTSADATRWRLKVATCAHCGERIRSRYRDRADPLICRQCVGTITKWAGARQHPTSIHHLCDAILAARLRILASNAGARLKSVTHLHLKLPDGLQAGCKQNRGKRVSQSPSSRGPDLLTPSSSPLITWPPSKTPS